MIKVLKSFYKISRPINASITFTAVVVAALIAYENNFPVLKIIIASLSAAFTAAAGNIINDIIDLEADKINHPQRLLPSGKLKKKHAVNFYYLILITSLILSAYVNATAFVITAIAHLLLYLYSIGFKNIPLFGNIVVSFLTGLTFIFGAAVVNNIFGGVIPAIFAFLINLIRELVKDVQDMEGDIKFSVITFPVKYGIKTTGYLTAIICSILILFSMYPFVFRIYHIEFFIITMAIINPVSVYCIKKFFHDHSADGLERISKILKINMVLGLAAIYLGR